MILQTDESLLSSISVTPVAKIGQGNLGSTFHVTIQPDYHKAVKSVPLYLFNESDWASLSTLNSLNNQNIVAYYDKKAVGDKCMIMQELCQVSANINCADLILASGPPIPECDVAYILKQALGALYMMHSINQCHKYIRPESIMFSSDAQTGLCVVKLGDHTLSRNFQQGIPLTKIDPFLYTAPEIWIKQQPQNFASDIWSLGIVIFQLLTKKLPYVTSSAQDFVNNAYQPLIVPQNISQELALILIGMLQPLPENRLTAIQALSNQYFAKPFFQIPGAPQMSQIGSVMQKDWVLQVKRLLGFLGRADVDPRAMDGSIALLNNQIVQEQQKFQNSENLRIQAETEKNDAIKALNALQIDNQSQQTVIQTLNQQIQEDLKLKNDEIQQLKENMRVQQDKLVNQKNDLDSSVVFFRVVGMDKNVTIDAGGNRIEKDVVLCSVGATAEENVERVKKRIVNELQDKGTGQIGPEFQLVIDTADDDFSIPPALQEESGPFDVIKSRIVPRDCKIIQSWNGGNHRDNSPAPMKRSQSPNPVSTKLPSQLKVRAFPWFQGRILVRFKTIDGIIYTKAIDPNITVDNLKKNQLTNQDRSFARPQDLKLCLIPRNAERGSKWTVLQNETKTLSSYKVRHEDTLTFVSSLVNRDQIEALQQRTLSYVPPNIKNDFTQGLRPISFKVTTTFGFSLNLNAFLNFTVSSLKLLIEDKTRILSEQSHRPNSKMMIINAIKADIMQLLYKGQQLTNLNATLSDIKLVDGEQITLITELTAQQQGGDGLHIIAHPTNGMPGQEIDGLTPQTTWNQVKQKIQEKMGIQIAQQKLIVVGKEADYNRTLAEYNIKNGDVIPVMIVGGGIPAPPGAQQIGNQATGGFVPGDSYGFVKVKLTKKDNSVSNLQIKLSITPKPPSRALVQGPETPPFTVLWLKQMIIQDAKIPSSILKLMFLNEELSDGNSLQYYNVKSGDELQCTQR